MIKYLFAVSLPDDDLHWLVQLPVAAQWREIGLQLGVPKDRLDVIQDSHAGKTNSVDLCFTDMFSRWLDNPTHITRRKLSAVLHTLERHDVEFVVKYKPRKLLVYYKCPPTDRL